MIGRHDDARTASIFARLLERAEQDDGSVGFDERANVPAVVPTVGVLVAFAQTDECKPRALLPNETNRQFGGESVGAKEAKAGERIGAPPFIQHRAHEGVGSERFLVAPARAAGRDHDAGAVAGRNACDPLP